MDRINESKVMLNSCPVTPATKTKTSSIKALDQKKSDCLVEETESEVLIRRDKEPKQRSKPSSIQNNPTAPAIDFKLDVKIEINSGKCILHASKPPAPPIPPKPSNQQQQQQQAKKPQNKPSPPQFFNPQANQQGIRNPNFIKNSNEDPGSTLTVNVDEQELYIKQYQQHQAQYLQYQKQNENKITNIIFPAIRMKAYYESTHVEINKRLFKKANLYSTIKLDSFVLPQTYMYQNDYFITKDMCIGPQLLDFLEHTLEPFSNKSQNKAQEYEPQSENEESNYHGNEFEYDDDELDEKEDTFDDQDLYARNTSPRNRYNSNSNNSNNNGENSIINSNPSISITNASNIQTQVYFPIDVIVVISMMPSSIRFTCAPQSTMDCLLKLPTIELVFSTKSLSTNKLLQKTESNERKWHLFY